MFAVYDVRKGLFLEPSKPYVTFFIYKHTPALAK